MSLQIDISRRSPGSGYPFSLELQLEIPAGQFVALYGPSGAGKSSLLRVVAGLDRPDTGSVQFETETWDEREVGIHLPTQMRRLGMVFQDYALFPNMTVRGNLAFAGAGKDLIDALLAEAGLAEWAEHKPGQLSGGQAQRVALVRALARRPRLLLLDEAFSALDEATREKMHAMVERMHRKWKLTTLMVSHDSSEVRRLADRKVVLQDGKVVADEALA